MTKQYAIYSPATNLYSVGYAHSIQQWVDLDFARLWDDIGPVKAHITHANKLAKHHFRTPPYDQTMLIVEVNITKIQNSIVSNVNV